MKNLNSYWRLNEDKVRELLDEGYTVSADPVVFLNTFPGRSLEGIARAIRRMKTEDLPQEEKPLSKQPRILILDIETSPLSIYAWHLHQNYIGPHQVVEDSSILCWAAKWLNDSKIYSESVNSIEAADRDDNSILQGLWQMIDDADIICGHNILRFDLARINSAFLVAGLPPTSPYQTIDTLKIVRKQFNFSSNKMDFLNQKLEIAGKIETDFNLWKRCLEGGEVAKKALEEMETYCRHDITCTEELYLTIRPWIKSHPNLALYAESYSSVCPACGSYDVNPNGFYYTPAGKYQSYTCDSCGSISRSRINSYDKLKRSKLLRGTAR